VITRGNVLMEREPARPTNPTALGAAAESEAT
jgi:hypothetical protein